MNFEWKVNRVESRTCSFPYLGLAADVRVFGYGGVDAASAHAADRGHARVADGGHGGVAGAVRVRLAAAGGVVAYLVARLQDRIPCQDLARGRQHHLFDDLQVGHRL